jgi:hypothetical protein
MTCWLCDSRIDNTADMNNLQINRFTTVLICMNCLNNIRKGKKNEIKRNVT